MSKENMDLKQNLSKATVDKRNLQKRSVQIKKSFDEVQKIIGSGKKKPKN